MLKLTASKGALYFDACFDVLYLTQYSRRAHADDRAAVPPRRVRCAVGRDVRLHDVFPHARVCRSRSRGREGARSAHAPGIPVIMPVIALVTLVTGFWLFQ